MIQFILTRRCNFRCNHCMWSCDPEGEHASQGVFAGTLKYIRQARAVNLLGGEPTLHPKFREYLLEIASAAHQVRLVTNGSWYNSAETINSIADASLILGDNMLVRISNDRWHRAFISEAVILEAAKALQEKGVRVVWDSMDDATIYPLGRALMGGPRRVVEKTGVLYEPAECIKKSNYNPLDNISIDANGDVSPCSHHQAICGNILLDSMDKVVSNAQKIINRMFKFKPINAHCAWCSCNSTWQPL